MNSAYRRSDGELLGHLVPHGDEVVAVDRLGRSVTGPVGREDAERALDERGLGYLADPYSLELPDGSVVPVRIVEVSEGRVRVKREDFGAIDGPRETWDLPNPAPPALRPR